MAVISAAMVCIWASRSARVGSAMSVDCEVGIAAEDGDGGRWVWWAAAAATDGSKVEAEDRRTLDTMLSRAW
jgi:hypothetical protein